MFRRSQEERLEEKLHKDIVQRDKYQKVLDLKLNKNQREKKKQTMYQSDGNIWNRRKKLQQRKS